MADYDVIGQGEDIVRRRKLLQAMQQQSMETPITGNTGLGQMLAKLATAYVTSKGQDKLREDDATNRAAYGTQLRGETNNYLDTMQGKAGQQMDTQQVAALLQRDQAPQLADPIKANPREAIVRAMTSQLPEMQALGKAGLSNMGKQAISPLDLLKLEGMSPASRVKAALSGNLGDLSGKESVHTVGDRLVRLPSEGAPQVAGDYRAQYAEPGQVGTDPTTGRPMLGQKELGTGEVKFAPQGTNVNIDTQGNKFALEQTGKVLEQARAGIMGADQQRQSAERIYNLSKDPQVLQGFGAGVLNGIGGLAAKLGMMGPEGPAKTQALLTEMAGNTLQRGTEMKGSFSDKDVAFLKQVSAGSIDLTPEAIQEVAALTMAASHNAILNSTQQYNSASSVNGAGEIAKLYPIPPRTYSLPDDPSFKTDDYGRVKYQSPLLVKPSTSKGYTAKPGRRMTAAEFLAEGQQ